MTWEPIAVVLLAGLTQLALAWRMRRDRLPRNGLAGIRTTLTWTNDATWYAAHRAAAARRALDGLRLN